ncbi:hypothetical protein MMPV_002212 [Pyropia vietnamensis]
MFRRSTDKLRAVVAARASRATRKALVYPDAVVAVRGSHAGAGAPLVGGGGGGGDFGGGSGSGSGNGGGGGTASSTAAEAIPPAAAAAAGGSGGSGSFGYSDWGYASAGVGAGAAPLRRGRPDRRAAHRDTSSSSLGGGSSSGGGGGGGGGIGIPRRRPPRSPSPAARAGGSGRPTPPPLTVPAVDDERRRRAVAAALAADGVRGEGWGEDIDGGGVAESVGGGGGADAVGPGGSQKLLHEAACIIGAVRSVSSPALSRLVSSRCEAGRDAAAGVASQREAEGCVPRLGGPTDADDTLLLDGPANPTAPAPPIGPPVAGATGGAGAAPPPSRPPNPAPLPQPVLTPIVAVCAAAAVVPPYLFNADLTALTLYLAAAVARPLGAYAAVAPGGSRPDGDAADRWASFLLLLVGMSVGEAAAVAAGLLPAHLPWTAQYNGARLVAAMGAGWADATGAAVVVGALRGGAYVGTAVAAALYRGGLALSPLLADVERRRGPRG